jgi:mRNA-degrading endonuclease RelE of RelBE toxin-antitoxin system
VSTGKFRIELQKQAHRDLEALGKEERPSVLEQIQRYLSTTPFLPIKTRIKKMTRFNPTLYRLRIGDFRAYYRIYQQTVIILAILHKNETKKWLK